MKSDIEVIEIVQPEGNIEQAVPDREKTDISEPAPSPVVLSPLPVPQKVQQSQCICGNIGICMYVGLVVVLTQTLLVPNTPSEHKIWTMTLLYFFMSVVFLCLIMLATSDPGVVKRHPPFNTDPTHPPTNDNNLTYCNRCCVWRDELTHHCSICQRCCRQFDHHCGVFGRCIGLRNHRWFISLLASGSMGNFCLMIADIVAIATADEGTKSAAFWVLLGFYAYGTLPLGLFACSQMVMIYQGRSSAYHDRQQGGGRDCSSGCKRIQDTCFDPGHELYRRLSTDISQPDNSQ